MFKGIGEEEYDSEDDEEDEEDDTEVDDWMNPDTPWKSG